jgi:hypothetical protein
LLPVLIFKDVNKTQEFADGLPPGSEVYMDRKSSYISTDSFVKWFIEHFLKNKASDKVILLLDGHRAHFSSPLLLQTAVEITLLSFGYQLTVRIPHSLWRSTFLSL